MKTVLITGTNRGIGLGLVKTILSVRYRPEHLIATCRKPAEAKELCELAKGNKNLHILQHDVADFKSYEKFHEVVKSIVGKNGLNLLINNAGIYGKSFTLGYLKPDSLIETFTVNTVAPIMMTKELLPLLKQAAENNSEQQLGPHRAAVVNVSSSLGSIAENDKGGYYPYRCSKSALNMATKSLSQDLRAYNILVTAIHPGWVKTDMGGPKAPLEVESATESIAKTVSSLNKSHNGCFVSFDGSNIPW